MYCPPRLIPPLKVASPVNTDVVFIFKSWTSLCPAVTLRSPVVNSTSDLAVILEATSNVDSNFMLAEN